jgi:hypothetical protein
MGARSINGLSGNPATPADGIMFPGSRTTFRDIRDGTTNTILIVETKDQNSAVWIDGTSAAVAARWFNIANPPSFEGNTVSLNYKTYFPKLPFFPNSIEQVYGPSSFHAGGAQHLMADGSVRFINDSTDIKVYDALSTRAGREIIDSAP